MVNVSQLINAQELFVQLANNVKMDAVNQLITAQLSHVHSALNAKTLLEHVSQSTHAH